MQWTESILKMDLVGVDMTRKILIKKQTLKGYFLWPNKGKIKEIYKRIRLGFNKNNLFY